MKGLMDVLCASQRVRVSAMKHNLKVLLNWRIGCRYSIQSETVSPAIQCSIVECESVQLLQSHPLP